MSEFKETIAHIYLKDGTEIIRILDENAPINRDDRVKMIGLSSFGVFDENDQTLYPPHSIDEIVYEEIIL